MRFVVNVLAVLYCVVLIFFWRGVLASEVCVFTTALLYICIYIQDIYIYILGLFETFFDRCFCTCQKSFVTHVARFLVRLGSMVLVWLEIRRARWRFCKKQVQARLPLRSRYRMLARLDGPQPMLE